MAETSPVHIETDGAPKPEGVDGPLGEAAMLGCGQAVESSPYKVLSEEEWAEHSALSRKLGEQGAGAMDPGAYARLIELERLTTN